jgi:lantibiotic biosynthesis protein
MVTAWSDPRARTLLEAAVAHVLALSPYSEHGTHPAWECTHAATPELGPDGAPIGRIAWCYGDLGMAMALFAAARALDDRACRDHALELARACAARDRESAWIADGGICHGAAGGAHAFNRLYRATAEPVFADAARRWVDVLLDLRGELPIAGFPQLVRSHDAAPVWQRDASLLTGAVGIALVAHALVSAIEPSWDRLLLLDVS